MSSRADRNKASAEAAPEPDARRVLAQLSADETAARNRLAQLEADQQRLADGVIRGTVTRDELTGVMTAIAEVNGQLQVIPTLRVRALELWKTQEATARREAHATALAVTREAFAEAVTIADEIDRTLAAIAPNVARLRSLLDWSEIRAVASERTISTLRAFAKDGYLDDRLLEVLRCHGIQRGRVESKQPLAPWIEHWTGRVLEIADGAPPVDASTEE